MIKCFLYFLIKFVWKKSLHHIYNGCVIAGCGVNVFAESFEKILVLSHVLILIKKIKKKIAPRSGIRNPRDRNNYNYTTKTMTSIGKKIYPWKKFVTQKFTSFILLISLSIKTLVSLCYIKIL
jgi:hypothetical protein